eukprot:GCRY01007513.1.p1 GENE.GCRY01007513.1~~GCRY01007513.1.p1  ORF type:complete len:246 (+),score=9.33 GCRY01007513.1:235-972(+)
MEGSEPINYICVFHPEAEIPNFIPQVIIQQCHLSTIFQKNFALQNEFPYESFNRFHLERCFKFMGCKPQHADSIADNFFRWINEALTSLQLDESFVPFFTYFEYMSAIRNALFSANYKLPEQILDYHNAHQFQQGQRGLVVLIGGTAGCGKSTLATLLASKLGLSTVVSTDHLRHMLRTCCTLEDNPVIFQSTYTAYKALSQQDAEPTCSPSKELVLTGYTAQANALRQIISTFVARTIQHRSVC